MPERDDDGRGWALRPERVKRAGFRPAAEDIALAVGLAVLAVAPLGVPALELGELAARTSAYSAFVLLLLQTLPLAIRRRAPAVALAVIGVAWGGAQLLGADTGLAGLGLLIALWSSGRYQSAHRRWTVAGGTLAYGLLAGLLVAAGSPERPVDWVTFWIVLAAPWCAGAVIREQRTRQSERERLLAAQAAADARSVIAADLHDVVAHHVTAMVVQAESTAFATDPLEHDERTVALESIGTLGRAALDDLRGLLDALDPGYDNGGVRPPASVQHLVARIRSTGYPITLDGADTLQFGPATTAVVHDVCREAVTNAMKHAPGAPVHIQLTAVSGARIELLIENPLPAVSHSPRPRPSGGGGRGLNIIERRVSAAGGSVRIERAPTYRITALLPIDFHHPSGDRR
ncbi:sensor histidine kinase [Leifsonia sp. SIMBA_070]|uniref:sensor histidine kinase n=1 Tax=Leifsonia sp. SIMBA_070 TaxID=3085810 RepID=UPI00397D9F38